jgi:hypothetical protein
MPQNATTQERLTKHDREIARIRKVVLTGMKILADLAASQRELQASQRTTDQQLQDFIRSLRQGTATPKRRVDLQ